MLQASREVPPCLLQRSAAACLRPATARRWSPQASACRCIAAARRPARTAPTWSATFRARPLSTASAPTTGRRAARGPLTGWLGHGVLSRRSALLGCTRSMRLRGQLACAMMPLCTRAPPQRDGRGHPARHARPLHPGRRAHCVAQEEVRCRASVSPAHPHRLMIAHGLHTGGTPCGQLGGSHPGCAEGASPTCCAALQGRVCPLWLPQAHHQRHHGQEAAGGEGGGERAASCRAAPPTGGTHAVPVRQLLPPPPRLALAPLLCLLHTVPVQGLIFACDSTGASLCSSTPWMRGLRRCGTRGTRTWRCRWGAGQLELMSLCGSSVSRAVRAPLHAEGWFPAPRSARAGRSVTRAC